MIESQPDGCGRGREYGDRKVLFYSCSGAADVAEASDRAARKLTNDGIGSMFCLAGLAANIDGMLETARQADVNVVIDGCNLGCARRIFEQLGLPNVVYVMVTDLKIDQGPAGRRATEEQVDQVADHIKRVISQM